MKNLVSVSDKAARVLFKEAGKVVQAGVRADFGEGGSGAVKLEHDCGSRVVEGNHFSLHFGEDVA